MKIKHHVQKSVETALDITERKKAEEALRESEGKLARILASVTDHISMIDRQHNIVWVNDVGEKLFGENIVGRKCYNVYYRYNKPCEKCAVLKSFEDGNIQEHEIEAITSDGNQKTFWSTASVAKESTINNFTFLLAESCNSN